MNDCSGGSTAKRRQENATETNRNESTSVAIVPTPDRPTLRDGLLPAADAAGGTAHQKQIPEPLALREQIRSAVEARVAALDRSPPLVRHRLESHAREVLGQLRLPEAYLGWTMVMLASAYWRDRVLATPYERRLLLLPHCMRNQAVCRAEYDEFGLRCADCGGCNLSRWRALGRRKGYQVLIAEGSPIVLQLILRGRADAVLGIGCLNSLEKALGKLQITGLPAMAVPLHSSSCANTSTDEGWALEMIDTPYRPGGQAARSQVHLLRAASRMFEAGELSRLLPARRGDEPLRELADQPLEAVSPLESTETLARDFLTRGGKYYRPFITLAAYDALRGGHGWGRDGARCAAQLPEAVKRVAAAMELFHKASLVHDDIEDDDDFRYGRPTIHRQHGVPVAVNVGDYLIGLGYRLVADQPGGLPADVVADVLAALAKAHARLCQGQGAELAWRSNRSGQLTPLDALKIYALKTAPAFEAALYAGVRLAGPADPYVDLVARFARHLGVAFQIQNDLDDWSGEPGNKRRHGTDVAAGRPTVLWALALEATGDAERRGLLDELADSPEKLIAKVYDLYCRNGVFSKARRLVQKHADRALEAAEPVEPTPLRDLLRYFVDTILSR
ncbi:MAG: polyprenyl synthetase family protein [Thermoguttaceae bacterium]|nr:polyprenyl synthetase family protein [Thermoguttaceae bacterium]MDI9444693.1 polyprenyl synthetase family protein [Planctomycetota bacterium]